MKCLIKIESYDDITKFAMDVSYEEYVFLKKLSELSVIKGESCISPNISVFMDF